MITQPAPGLEGYCTVTVGPESTAIRYGSGLVEVFATPAMIALMEKTAQDSIQPHIADGQITLGTEICVSHSRAVGIGAQVNCKSLLIETDGRKFRFEVSVFNNDGMIGKGYHVRMMADKDRFMHKLGLK